MFQVQPIPTSGGNKLHALKPVMLLSQIFGFTFFYTNSEKINILHRFVVVILLILALVNEIPSITFWIESSEGLHGILVKFETSSRWSIFFLNYILTTLKSGKIKTLVRDLLDCELDLSDGAAKKTFRIHILHLIFNFSFIVSYDVLGHAIVWANSNYKSFTSMVYIFNDFVIMWSSWEFAQIANLIRECFKAVNEKMKSYKYVKNRKNSRIIGEDIIKLRKIHLDLCRASTKMNSCFSIQLSLIILISLIQITYALRAMLSDVISPNFYKYDIYMDFAINVVWGCMYMFMVYQMIAFGDITTYESRKTSTIVHQLINSYHGDKWLEKELELFSIQIKHHSAAFTLWLFDLNFKLLHTIIGTLTTYMILIITFNGEWGQDGLAGWDFSPSDYSSNQ